MINSKVVPLNRIDEIDDCAAMVKEIDEMLESNETEEQRDRIITIWRGSDEDTQPVKLFCKVFEPLQETICGEIIYQNVALRPLPSGRGYSAA